MERWSNGEVVCAFRNWFIRGVVFLTLAVTLIGCREMAERSDLYPPTAPQRETIQHGNLEFVAECRARVTEIAQRLGWRLDGTLLTRSEEWGLIWRIDFRIPTNGPDSLRINRVICWSKHGTVEDIATATVYGQDVAPLPRNGSPEQTG